MSELLQVRLEVADVLDEEVFRELPVHLNAAVEQQDLSLPVRDLLLERALDGGAEDPLFCLFAFVRFCFWFY